MKIDILSLFPQMFEGWKNKSIIGRAVGEQRVDLNVIDFRPFSKDQNHRIDDYPCGGGAGLVMQIQPIVDCLDTIKTSESKVILVSPRGEQFNQSKARLMSQEKHLIFICGHYEGIDERINHFIDETISLGDFILTGGELPAMCMSDAIIRLLDGVIDDKSSEDESFENGLLEYPQYTNPREFRGLRVPDILYSGNHQAIDKWRKKESLIITKNTRVDLFNKYQLSKKDKELLTEGDNPKWLVDAIAKAKKFMEES